MSIYNFHVQEPAITAPTESDMLLAYDASPSRTGRMTMATARAFMNGGFVNVTDAATYTCLAADSGKVHICPNFTATCTIDLPAAASGLRYTFISKAVAADAQNIVIDTTTDTNFFLGGVLWGDLNGGAGADELGAVFPDGNSNSILTVVTPSAGTVIDVICDGTNWIFLHSVVISDSTPTFADQS